MFCVKQNIEKAAKGRCDCTARAKSDIYDCLVVFGVQSIQQTTDRLSAD